MRLSTILKILAKTATVIYSIYAFACFLLIMILFIPFVIIASFFGKVNGGNIIYDGCRVWADIWLFLIGISHKNIFDVPHDSSCQYIFVSNHISYMDIPVMMKAIRRQHFRILGKAELGKIPLFGFIFKQAAVSVDRKNPENRAKSMLTLKSIIKRKISVFICPEGTFNETHKPLKEFYDGAFRIAIETQTPIKPILILDTYDRLNYKSIFSLSPGRSRVIFLGETQTDTLSISDVFLLKEKIYKQMEEGLMRYNASWISK
ncbi:MAG: 1-acyl-sn-glycerol-3-phosphate acyltransferase [Chitinophagaceae bacterium]|nr:1-acyl-sn-glycerol-3-phosphate acyltransferase [Chitinophagaceae bacterium]